MNVVEPVAKAIPDLVDYQAELAPDAVAVSCGEQVVTYRELVERADRVAAWLRARELAPESVVAVLMHRGADLVVVLLGVLKAGCAYLALNPDDPRLRLGELVRDAGAPLVVAGEALAALAPDNVEVVPAGDVFTGGQAAGRVPVFSDNLAYVCYTSGSTGAPKGVAVTHRGVLRLVRDSNWLQVKPDDVFLQVGSVSFDAATLEIFGALANGCRLVVHPGGGPAELDAIAETVRARRVTVVNLVTSLLHQLVTSAPSAFAGVRHVITGGDVASPALVSRLLEAHPGVLFTNGYGPTENTTFTTTWTSTEPPAPTGVPIGEAVSGTTVTLLDASSTPVADGETGELYTSGAGLARGYLGRPAATAERFLPDPSGPPGSRRYRTGDLARRLPGGDLEFAGRVDHQVKINGYRVEPGAVESALNRRPNVEQAIVVAHESQPGRKRLVAYVVPAEPDGTGELGTRLRDELRAELPAYLVPSTILVRDELPLNHNGKVARELLATTGRRERDLPEEFVAPSTELQRHLAGLWGEVLDVDPVGVHDDFFDLGGHSLLAAELLDLLHRELGVEVPAHMLYLQPTIAELSAAVSELPDQTN